MCTKKSVARMAVATLAALMVSGPASADGGAATSISIDSNFGAGTESFTATGGVLCPEGTSHTDSILFAGRGSALTFHGVKTLTCADGTGTFRIEFDAATTAGSPQDQGGWRAIDGTGAYATVGGGGKLVGTYDPEGVDDLYTGYVHS